MGWWDTDDCGISWMDGSSGLLPDSLSIDAIRSFIDMGEGVDTMPDDIDPSDIISVLDRYGLLCDDGTVTFAGALLFSKCPSAINRGAIVKIRDSQGGGVLNKEVVVEAPLILVPGMVMDILFGRLVPADVYPESAIRELIINALVHKDYRLEEPVAVTIRPDRIVIFSPGGLPDGWTVESLTGRHRAIPRNPMLADVFHDAGCMEGWAQGIGRVLKSCGTNGNPRPEFVAEHGEVSVTLFPAKRSKRFLNRCSWN